MGIEPTPVFVGDLGPMYRSDKQDFYINIAADLVEGEAVQSVTFSVVDSDGQAVSGVVDEAPTVTADQVDFRVTAPATVGDYKLLAIFTIDDEQKITKTARLRVV